MNLTFSHHERDPHTTAGSGGLPARDRRVLGNAYSSRAAFPVDHGSTRLVQ